MTTGRWVRNHDSAVAFSDAMASTPLTCFPLIFETNDRAFETSRMAASIASEAVGICVHSVQWSRVSRHPLGLSVFSVLVFLPAFSVVVCFAGFLVLGFFACFVRMRRRRESSESLTGSAIATRFSPTELIRY